MAYDSMAATGLGQGFIQGLQLADKRASDRRAEQRAEGLYGLNMERGRQQIDQSNELFPMQVKAAQQGLDLGQQKLDQGELTLKDAERKDWYGAQAQQALAASQAAMQGDWSKANEWSANISAKTGADTLMWFPTNDHNVVAYRASDTEHKNPIQFKSPTEAVQAFYRNADPEQLKNALTQKPKEEKWQADNKGYLYETGSGRVKQYRDDGGTNGKGRGGLSTTDENTLNRWLEGYFGKRDVTGQFVLTDEQKYQAVQAQKMAVNMINSSPELSLSEAYSIAAAAVAGGLPKEKALALAKQQIDESEIPKTIKGGWSGNSDVPNPDYQSAIEKRASELMMLNQQDAQKRYNQIMSGQQGHGLVAPQQGGQAQVAAQPKVGLGNVPQTQAAPQIPQGRTGTLNGRKVIVTNDNHVFDATTGEQLQ